MPSVWRWPPRPTHDAEALMPLESPVPPFFSFRDFGTVRNAQRGVHLLHVKQEEANADGRGQSGFWIDALADEWKVLSIEDELGPSTLQ